MHVTVKATVRMGKAVSVTVKTTPPDPGVATCIEGAVRGKQWDISPRAGVVTVTY
jgi:hypothetical protein